MTPQPPRWSPPPGDQAPDVLAKAWDNLPLRKRRRIVRGTLATLVLAVVLPVLVVKGPQALDTPVEPANPPSGVEQPVEPREQPRPAPNPQPPAITAFGPWTETPLQPDGLPTNPGSILLLSPNGAVQTSSWATVALLKDLPWQPAPPGSQVIVQDTNRGITLQLAGGPKTFRVGYDQVFLSEDNPSFLYAVSANGNVRRIAASQVAPLRPVEPPK
jgi:hypothetical protein